MKRIIALALCAILTLWFAIPAIAEDSFSYKDYGDVCSEADITMNTDSSGAVTSGLPMCDQKTMFLLVHDYQNTIQQIFFISNGIDIVLTFLINGTVAYRMPLWAVNSDYSYHTLYKDEKSLVEALGSAKTVSITVEEGTNSSSYDLTEEELHQVNAVFGYLASHNFVDSVDESYVEVCVANSVVLPITMESVDTEPSDSFSGDTTEPNDQLDDEVFQIVEEYLSGTFPTEERVIGTTGVVNGHELECTLNFDLRDDNAKIMIVTHDHCRQFYPLTNDELFGTWYNMITCFESLESSLPEGWKLVYQLLYTDGREYIIDSSNIQQFTRAGQPGTTTDGSH